MAETRLINIKPDPDAPENFNKLVGRCYKENPSEKDLRELRIHLKENPGLYRYVFDLSNVLRTTMIDGFVNQETTHQAIETNIEMIIQELGYDNAPMIEKLLINNIANCWLRLQWVEYQVATFMGRSEVRFAEVEYWEKRLSATQRRYLRACETLARIRKITRSTLQINIAEEGSQQVNIAGDLVRSKNQK